MCMSSFWLHALLPLILQKHNKLLPFLSDLCPDHHMLNVKTFLWDTINNEPHVCPFIGLDLTSCANSLFRPCHLELTFLLVDFCLPLELTILMRHISYTLSRKLCSHLFRFHTSRVILTPFFLTVALFLVALTVAPFDTSLKTLIIILTSWGT